ncbi:MAG: chemotaxis protein CheW [Methylococcales bacterium]|jgi:chemotaxis signal transduction protein|nr:chemotaxis protein CheW [Methylococcales bacterium]
MMRTQQKNHKIAAQDDALGMYLGALLEGIDLIDEESDSEKEPHASFTDRKNSQETFTPAIKKQPPTKPAIKKKALNYAEPPDVEAGLSRSSARKKLIPVRDKIKLPVNLPRVQVKTLSQIETTTVVKTKKATRLKQKIVQPNVVTKPATTKPLLPTNVITEVKPTLESSVKVDVKQQAPAVKQDIRYTPEWGKKEFQCLLFKLNGLILAIPLLDILSIEKWNGECTAVPGQVDWMLGVYPFRNKKTLLVDTASLIMPEMLNKFESDNRMLQYKHIILIDDGRWGLVCNTVSEVITLKTDDVRWRKQDAKRQWLVGTIINHMYWLLDMKKFKNLMKIN